MTKYTIGVDFGSLSCRGVLLNAQNGEEIAVATKEYPHGVMQNTPTKQNVPAAPDTALQHPADYLLALRCVLAELFASSGIEREAVVGIGIDFTCCTMLPVLADGTPLAFLPAFVDNPHAYVKMWKHHAAQKYADRINEVAKARGEKWLSLCGGTMSSEFMFPKIYQTLDEAPEVYAAAHAFMEAGDWINFRLTGTPTCGYQYAAYKCQYTEEAGYPNEEFFAAVDERLRYVVRDKLPYPVVPAAKCIGRVSEAAAKEFGLAPGTAVATAAPDAHVAACALDTCREGDSLAVLGTSACFYALSREPHDVQGICGTVKHGVVPGLYGYEAGLCCFGDHFAYAADRLTSPAYEREADEEGISMLQLLLKKAAKKQPGESGVLALNWFNGNRSVLINSDLSGLFVGITLDTAPEDLLRALLEACAFGTRNIYETFAKAGLRISRLVASGGIARKDPFTMQLLSDVTGLDIRIAKTAEAPAHGSAVNAAVAAGLYESLPAAIAALSGVGDTVYHPSAAHKAVYDKLYAEYKKLHDYFGRGENNVMLTLRQLAAKGAN